MKKRATRKVSQVRDAVSIVKHFYPKVEHVRNATEKAQFTVRKTDATAEGVLNHKDCAAARACRRDLGADGAVISRSTAYIVIGDTAVRYRVPESMSREIVAFDRGANFAPGEYELGLPDRRPLGDSHSPNRSVRKSHSTKGLRGKPKHLTAGLRTALNMVSGA